MTSNDLKRGLVILLDNAPCLVLDVTSQSPSARGGSTLIKTKYRNLLTGKMATTADMITSLDTPVDLVPMGETDEERDRNSGGKTRRWLRSAFSLLAYVALFALVFGYLGNLA